MRRRDLLAGAATLGMAGCAGSNDDQPELVDDEEDDGEPGDDDESSDAGGRDSDDPDGATETDDDGDDGETESGGASDEVEAVVGTLVDGENLHLVVEDVDTTTELGPFQQADEGNEYVVVYLALKNVTSDFLHVSQLLQASLRDDEDYRYNMALAGGDDPVFNDGQFAPGEVERGTIAFEVPADTTGRRLEFDLDVSIFGGVERVDVDLEEETEPHRLEQTLAIDTYDIGDTVEYGGVEVGVNEVDVTSELGQFAAATADHEYVVVDLSVTNNTGEDQYVSTWLQMMLKDGQGYTYQEDWIATAELTRAFDESAPLADGETRAGEVVYEVEEALRPLYWVFEYTLWTEGDKTFWQLR